MPFNKPFGLKPGDKCPSCRPKSIRLRPVVLLRVLNPTSLIGPMAEAPTDILERLACANCSRSFEALDRGRSLADLREAGINEFANPSMEPKQCPHCANPLGETLSRPMPTTSPRNRDDLRTRYKYCPFCNHVLWIIARPFQNARQAIVATSRGASRSAVSPDSGKA